MSPTTPQRGVLLVGHGTRSAVGAASFLALARLVADRLTPIPLEPAFLELARPTIAAGLCQLMERGAREIVVAPLLLFAAGHAKEDVPAAVEAARREQGLPELKIVQAGQLGCHPAIIELSSRRFTESLQGLSEVAENATCLLLVGRGSSDPSAVAEMYQLARLCQAQAGVIECRVAFVAVAKPTVEDALAKLAAEPWRRVVVQPHLLFPGEVLDSLQEKVEAIAAHQPQQQWIITSVLGAGLETHSPANEPLNALLVEAIADRITEGMRRNAMTR